LTAKKDRFPPRSPVFILVRTADLSHSSYYFGWMTIMLRRSFGSLLVLATVSAISADYSVYAQDSDRFDRYFRELDRDNNGELSTEEYQRLRDSTRERMLQMGIAGNRPVKKDEFVAGMEGAEEIRQKEQELERERNGGTTSSGDRGSSGRGSDSRRGRGKTRVTFTLPSQYVPQDKNTDGQISLSEWDRAKLTEFRTLDRNGDGYLTPQELVSAASPTAARPAGTASTLAKPSSSTPQPGAPTPAATPTAPAEDPLTRQAKFYFGTVDKDKDGQITTEEWAGSRGVRPMFEKASVAPALPMNEAAFSEQFKKIKAAEK
jgi:Ca2+-binding EF-hand superfamily protein